MKQQFMKTAFFDFDGVVVDTEPIYDIYWNEAGKRYQTGIPNFASHIKGTTLPYILEKYFSDRSEEFKEKVIRESMEFEQQMPFPPVPGAMEFIHLLKSKDVSRFGHQFRQCQIGTGFPPFETRQSVRYGRECRPDHKRETRSNVLFACRLRPACITFRQSGI